jgi:demethylmenaquinone methyltransferase/2-methoxy-6-polyprenyl-1,4-benzoquinol methylase
MTMMKNTTHFGFKEVATQDKQSMVRGVFDSVANQYDLMNDVLSFGTVIATLFPNCL